MTNKTAATKTTATKTADKASANNSGTESNVTDLVQVSKVDRAKKIFDTISAAGYEPAEGSSPRKDFIAKCISDLGMTEAGASTYWQNLRKETETGNRYPHAKAPTGAPRGRKVDVGGRMKKAAAKVQAKRDNLNKAMAELQAAEGELVEMTTDLIAQAS